MITVTTISEDDDIGCSDLKDILEDKYDGKKEKERSWSK